MSFTKNYLYNFSNQQKKDIICDNKNYEIDDKNDHQIDHQINNTITIEKSKELKVITIENTKFSQIEKIEPVDIYNEIEIKQDELEKYHKILNELELLKEIHKDLSLIIGNQADQIQEIQENIVVANEIINISNDELLNADKHKIENTSTKLTISTVGSTLVGAVAFTTCGWKIGLILGGVALISGTTWAIFKTS